MEQCKSMSFDVHGEFITNLARERFFQEGIEYESVMDLLLSCMEGTKQSRKELLRLAEDILIGRAALVGSTREGTYHLELYEPEEQPGISESFDIFKKLSNTVKKLKDTQKELSKMQEWYAVAINYVPEYRRNDVFRETGQPMQCSYGDNALSSFMERMMDDEEHSTEDYGWLEPNGKFHSVEWGEHQTWADEWKQKNLTEDEYLLDTHFIAGDYLAERGWVLLHNPSQGIAIPTKKETHRYTKAQQEFLYDYYMERGKEKEANAVYQDD